MSVQPGWYQDPEGPKGQARYWDGSRWGPGRTGAAGVADAEGRREPDPAQRPWLWPAGIVAVIGVLVALGYFLLPSLLGPDGTQTIEPTGSATPAAPPDAVGELDCAAANSENFDKGPELRVAGIVVPFPDSQWGFRFDRSQWTWINDLHAWGTVEIEPAGEGWAAGIVAGRLEAGSGFGEPQQAAEAVVECLTTRGAFNTGEEMGVASSQAVVVDGMPGWSMELRYPEEGTYGATVLQLLAIDTGQQGSLAVVVGFHPEGEPVTSEVVRDSIEGIRSA